MSENKRSFWSSIPGLVTGLAGLLTGVVGLVTVLIQLDVIGGDKADKPAAGVNTTVAGNAATPTTDGPAFTVAPTTLDFKPTDPRDKDVTVKNVSRSASLKLASPRVDGSDSNQFTTALGSCSSAVPAGGTCTLRVSFKPAGPLRSYSATLEVSAPGASAETIDLKATTIL